MSLSVQFWVHCHCHFFFYCHLTMTGNYTFPVQVKNQGIHVSVRVTCWRTPAIVFACLFYVAMVTVFLLVRMTHGIPWTKWTAGSLTASAMTGMDAIPHHSQRCHGHLCLVLHVSQPILSLNSCEIPRLAPPCFKWLSN